ncbi:PTS sugar transporter subunit IIA [Lacticaseibacillus sp. N501-2]|jgi:PTS system mannose-specific IIA component|uniref:PTS sugar transporter subunit IIA n=1 Tax=Lacticaseibacillus salsurae TaxID=3367729 RepID=UPI0038B2F6BE
MTKVLIVSHGHFASGLKNSIGILTGMAEKVEAIDAYVDDSDYTPAIASFIEASGSEPAIIFTDLMGGSVNQKVMLAAENAPNIIIVTQMNLAIILAVLLDGRPMTSAVVDELIGQSQVQRVTLQHQAPPAPTEDEFFE